MQDISPQNSAYRLFNQTTYLLASQAAIYSTFVVDKATVDCKQAIQLSVHPPTVNT
jgi:hypothetical protein